MSCSHTILPDEAAREVRDGVAEIFGIEPHRLSAASRRREIMDVRQLAYWTVRQTFPQMSFPDIGNLFGGRDHSTVIHGCGVIDKRRAAEAGYRALTDLIAERFAPLGAMEMVLTDELREKFDAVSAAKIGKLSRMREALDPDAAPTKPKNRFADDSDALERMRGTDALGAAIERERQAATRAYSSGKEGAR